MALAEPQILSKLSWLKQRIVTLHQSPKRSTYEQMSRQYADQLKQLADSHRQRKQQRDRQRLHSHNHLPETELKKSLLILQQQSQQDGIERRQLKQNRDRALEPIAQEVSEVEQQIRELKRQYTTLSQNWQALMQQVYLATLASKEQHLKLEDVDRNLWQEECRLSILYQDEHLIVVEKPAGLLSVPGRRYTLQDSVLSRLCYQLPKGSFLAAVHRLDQATSGVLAIARSPQSHKALSQQFAQRQVHKTYEAILSRPINNISGTISLPLWGDPETRPRQIVDTQKGKPSQTEFRMISNGEQPRIQFVPQTGRTHQLRVHAAHPNGLNSPILGDCLYKGLKPEKRLHLHAASLEFQHPITKTPLRFSSAVPF
ncbi:MAG: hypothetical protein DCF25_03360 [Leptolyngbya foveolarum]|uniref:RNA pseudouridylate synthase n=1 Tax=Leptolyngbya foveolarum TaxID=47253 RepID=A0A2W4ULE9_9CYAN|nr:MAG: hypothetical protein DCF25_03360 [Leptolyngbya foveolarum]